MWLSYLYAGGGVGDGDIGASDTDDNREKQEVGQAVEQMFSSSLRTHYREQQRLPSPLRVESRHRA